MIGAQNWDQVGGPDNVGLATIWYGNTTGLPRWGTPYYSNVMIEGEQDGAVFSRTLTAAGDVNDDGFDDLAIGSFFYDGGQNNEGAVFAFYKAPTGHVHRRLRDRRHLSLAEEVP